MEIITNIADFSTDDKIAVTLGNFDGVHLGHRKLLGKVIKLAGENNLKSAVMTFHPHPIKFFKSDVKLLTTREQKINIFKNMGIDYLFLVEFDNNIAGIDPEVFIREYLTKKMNAEYIVVGHDYKFGSKRKGDFNLLQLLSNKYSYTPIQIDKVRLSDDVISSTNIRNALIEGELDKANSMLGKNYTMTGTIVKGDGIATKMGFPTANMDSDNELIPKNGVYAAYLTVKGKKHEGATYIGRRPTFAGELKLRVETNIFNFNEDIYDEPAELELAKYIRTDKRFESKDELAEQIRIDCDNIKEFFSQDN